MIYSSLGFNRTKNVITGCDQKETAFAGVQQFQTPPQHTEHHSKRSADSPKSPIQMR